MRVTVIDAPQRSEAWFQARLGRLTGSRAADALATLKGKGEAAGRRNLRLQLVLERLMGRSQESGYLSQPMQDGIDREPDALALYEAVTGRLLHRTGFLSSDELLVGCSLDGHVNDLEGIAECKCPMPATHLEYLRTGVIPDGYKKQIVHNLWISGAAWCDWLSYQPAFPEPLKVKLIRVLRDDAEIASYEIMARAFLHECDRELAEIERLVNAGVEQIPEAIPF